MSRNIHLNLIQDDELVSSSPVRNHIIAPITVLILTLITLSWWSLKSFTYSQLKQLRAKHDEIDSQLEPRYHSALDLNAQEKNLTAINTQLMTYRKSKLVFGEALKQIPEYVLPNIEFSKLEIPPPPHPLFNEKHKDKGPTNLTESVKIVITGRTTGANTFDAVDHLLQALKGDAFTNLIQSAQIPKGSFRQDITRKSEGKEYLLFGLECECFPRKFE